ncbi:MAG: 9-O-acetylesterase, partial [Planctomycetota bacterium]
GLRIGDLPDRAEGEPAAAIPLRGFAIAGEDRRWFWAEASIDGATVLVRSPHVPAPQAVRYAFAQNPMGANLYGATGLPASPFRSDDW